MALYRAEGIVLRGRPLGEADRIVTVFTREEGVIEGVARGSRRPRSRLAGSTLLFTQANMLLFRGKSLDSISQVEVVHTFQALRDDLFRTAYASYWCELVAEMVPQREPNEDVYLFFLAALLLLEQAEDPGLLSTYFELRLMCELGYRPALDNCGACGSPMDGQPGGSFLPVSGTVLCPRCTLANASGHPLSGASLALLHDLIEWDIRRLGVLRPAKAVRFEVNIALRAFEAAQAGRAFKSLQFLEGLESQA